jgi:glycerol 2-dehydrogenase (NADP+)
VARGSSVLAKSTTPWRIEANRKLIELDDDDMGVLNKIHEKGLHRYVYPEFGVNLGFPDKQ